VQGPLNGPKANRRSLSEGWSFHKPRPRLQNNDNSAEASYYSWVDQHDTLGRHVPISTANLQDGFAALGTARWCAARALLARFYAKGLDGRIDDPNAGWKGRGLWSSSGDRTPYLIEGGGPQTDGGALQVRPDPLAH
jgi:hypothetical protein